MFVSHNMRFRVRRPNNIFQTCAHTAHRIPCDACKFEAHSMRYAKLLKKCHEKYVRNVHLNHDRIAIHYTLQQSEHCLDLQRLPAKSGNSSTSTSVYECRSQRMRWFAWFWSRVALGNFDTTANTCMIRMN